MVMIKCWMQFLVVPKLARCGRRLIRKLARTCTYRITANYIPSFFLSRHQQAPLATPHVFPLQGADNDDLTVTAATRHLMLIPGRFPMNLPSSVVQTRSLISSLPSTILATQLALAASPTDTTGDRESNSILSTMTNLTPKTQSVIYMAAAMALHFGGYEFIRNSCLALFTSSQYGFSSPAAYPLANGLVSPFSVFLLWGYGLILDKGGPRVALKMTTFYSILFIAVVSCLLAVGHSLALPKVVCQTLVGITFLFQNSFQYLLYTQQWSFVGSVMTPEQGARWFATLTGLSSLVSTACGGLVPYLLPFTGLLGLMAATCITLTMSLFCADRAYALAQKHGFDPGTQVRKKKENGATESRISQAVGLFSRVPTLRALLVEVLSFQSLNTILNVAFVRALKSSIPDDLARSAYSGRFYSLINAVSATLQFGIMPFVMKYSEPAMIWRLMPLVPVAICGLQVTHLSDASLTLLAAAFFLAKTMDYSLRSVVYAMVYQPLDFESRYVGKEIIGVFGSRFGKSGMSVVLGLLSALGMTGLTQLGQFSLGASLLWMSSTWWLSRYIPRKADAQAQVEERTKETDQKKND